MIDLTQNYSIPWSTFGVSAIDQSDLSYTFVVGIENIHGSQFSLARVWPTGHGVGVTLGKACTDCTIQSVVHVQGVTQPVALTMRPASAGAKQYTYSWEPWNITAGEPVDAQAVEQAVRHRLDVAALGGRHLRGLLLVPHGGEAQKEVAACWSEGGDSATLGRPEAGCWGRGERPRCSSYALGRVGAA